MSEIQKERNLSPADGGEMRASQEKRIQEVFPDLELTGELEEFMDLMRVSQVSVDRGRRVLHIRISGHQWVHRKYVDQLEEELHRQLFSDADLQIRIEERFRLSAQYTPERLMEVYRPSILYELKKRDVLLFYLFHTARLSFPEEDTLLMELEDSVIAHERGRELTALLEKVFHERCGMEVRIETGYMPMSGRKTAEENDRRMRSAARQICLRAKHLQTDEGAQAAAMPAEGVPAAPDQDSAGREPVRPAGPVEEKRASGENAGGRKKKQGGWTGRLTPEDPDGLLYGRGFDDEAVEIASLDESTGVCTIRGEIIASEVRELKSGKGMVIFAVTDDTDTIRTKLFVDGDQIQEAGKLFGKGKFVRIRGSVMMDSWEKELTVSRVFGIRRSSDFRQGRYDDAPVKRAELHCHTKMSDMDGVTDAAKLVRQAYKWGHPAIAITDHGVVQAFPEANHAMEDIDGEFRKQYQKEHPEATKEELKKISAPFKVIYGCEVYLVDDLKGIASHSLGQSLDQAYVVFDIETTGLSNLTCKIIEIGAVRVENGRITDRFSTFVNPQVPIPYRIEQLTSINDSMVINAPTITEVLPAFLQFCEGAVMVAHNADFDMGFIIKACEEEGLSRKFTWVDTVAMAQLLLPSLSRFKLDTVAKAVGVSLEHHHRAVDDAYCTAEIFVEFVKRLKAQDITDLDRLNEAGRLSANAVRKLKSHHAIILAANETGRVNLYRCVSESHLKYVHRQPKLPKSFFLAHREGLIIGSACEAGELYQALLRGAPEEEIAQLVGFYDYLEIQPLGNNAFMIDDDRNDTVHSEEDLKELNRRIVRLGEQFRKPVVAACDVHFMNPEDEIYRRIIMKGKKFDDADNQAPLFLRTTEEMLAEFDYLGSEKAREVVIDNPRKICDMVEKISPIRAGKFPPVIENSDQTLREICMRRAHEIYGEKLPEIVDKRLERELNSIISNGYAVMYIIAQKLVWKCNEDGYLVGSRGSVGSSLAATMSGITEVNPLPPHYLCENCHYVDFDSELVQKYADEGQAGCDMPDAVCPRCGAPLKKMGYNIPFETFLGFKGNKEPDIDLNFSGEYQSKAHKYTEVIFGPGQTFKAGTIGTLADKTAFGFVKNYYEEKGESRRTCEIDRIVQGCVGIRRTTGQHPGGIIVLPLGEDINAFTPVQHPADDPDSDIISTHFDYHSIDANLLKLDILGHDDPTMIRVLQDFTGKDPREIPMDEPKVMSLFLGTEALGLTPADIRGTPLGCLGIPEFGTDFAMQMLIDTQPRNFSDLARIAGLAHGTDVWLGNAETLIKEGKCTLGTAICCRDDIMIYLISRGLEPELSFTIMEAVRKGKGLKPEWETEMRAHQVPDWYIWSCKKIKYMFPKGHAVAYVMMAYRIAWYKVYEPLAYYAAFFSIRADAFSYEKMCMGQQRLEELMDEYEARKDTLTAQEQAQMRDMRVVQEMYARGYSFVPIDLYRAQAHRFQILDGALMPSLDSIEGLGSVAADSVVLAARDGEFLSRDDFRRRAKVGKTISDTLARLGILSDLPETNQISLFDFGM